MVSADPAADVHMRPVATGLQFPEGPIVLRDGSVLLVEIRRGTLTRITPDGRVSVVAHGSRVYVAETGPGRVWSWDLAGPGRIREDEAAIGPGGATLLHGFSGYQPLDSLAVDGDGNVCVATLVTGAVSVLAPDGTLLRQVRVPEPDPFVTNICFTGADSRAAYITSSGRGILYTLEWATPGLDLAFAA
ncbi:SMP-30/gluconolactonase/LRE family protein [Pseudonocardia sp. DLS-67]